MPDLRKDPIVGRWVIIAENRARRPQEVVEAAANLSAGRECPFCEGNEPLTPHEICARRKNAADVDGQGWSVRVVPNRYPALQLEGDIERSTQGFYDRMSGVGAHEVIVESPRHLTSTTELSLENLSDVLLVYRDRLLDLQRDTRLVSGMIFKNVGAAAGASLEHTHSQLIVTPIVPISILEELDGAAQFFRDRRRCVFCEMIDQEQAQGARMVASSPHFAAFCPYAPRFPFETWILPVRHASHYETLTEGLAAELALILQRTLVKIETALHHPAYNYILHTAPFDTHGLDHYHWHIEIIPRVTKTAGYEWGSGFYINPVPPETAASTMRGLGEVPGGGQESITVDKR